MKNWIYLSLDLDPLGTGRPTNPQWMKSHHRPLRSVTILSLTSGTDTEAHFPVSHKIHTIPLTWIEKIIWDFRPIWIYFLQFQTFFLSSSIDVLLVFMRNICECYVFLSEKRFFRGSWSYKGNISSAKRCNLKELYTYLSTFTTFNQCLVHNNWYFSIHIEIPGWKTSI